MEVNSGGLPGLNLTQGRQVLFDVKGVKGFGILSQKEGFKCFGAMPHIRSLKSR